MRYRAFSFFFFVNEIGSVPYTSNSHSEPLIQRYRQPAAKARAKQAAATECLLHRYQFLDSEVVDGIEERPAPYAPSVH
jgi:hypothetical protein